MWKLPSDKQSRTINAGTAIKKNGQKGPQRNVKKGKGKHDARLQSVWTGNCLKQLGPRHDGFTSGSRPTRVNRRDASTNRGPVYRTNREKIGGDKIQA